MLPESERSYLLGTKDVQLTVLMKRDPLLLYKIVLKESLL
jgi:hypothetical protein